ncbi:hypothetical protein D3C73_706990 [compost metagenome]
MVPGEFRQVTPCFSARPERGRTWASWPGCRAIFSPVGISLRWPGSSTTVSNSAMAARRSIPAEPAVS